MSKLIVSLLILILLAVPATARVVGDPGDALEGDPWDSNDIIGNDSFAESGCALAYQYPYCVPCQSQCMFAMMADADHNGNMNWNW